MTERPARRGARGGGASRYVEVVLDDHSGPADRTPTPPASGHGRRRSGRGVLPAWAAAAAAAALLAVLVSHGVADEQERAALARYAHLPGVVGSLSDPLDAARVAADVVDDPGPAGGDRGPTSDRGSSASARVLDRAGTGFGVRTHELGGRWYLPDGAPGPAWQGRLVEPAVTDVSTPRLLLLESPDGERVQAWDVVDGTVAWQRTGPERPLLRLDGTVVLAAGDRLEAVDARTGRSLWVVHPVGETLLADPPALTDGLRVAVPAHRDDGTVALTAYALDSGARQWTTTLGD